jgi:hypothetical protein
MFELRVKRNYIQANVKADVLANLLDFFSPTNQQIGGTLHISDIYAIIDNTTGVDSSSILAIIPVPYARPSVTTLIPLAWTPALQPSSTTTNIWKMVFTSATTFQLFRNNAFLGAYSTGVVVSQLEIVFTITGTYTIGDNYTFVTYPYATNDLVIAEPSIPTALTADITINAIGGL